MDVNVIIKGEKGEVVDLVDIDNKITSAVISMQNQNKGLLQRLLKTEKIVNELVEENYNLKKKFEQHIALTTYCPHKEI